MNLRRFWCVAVCFLCLAQETKAQCALPYNIQNGQPADATKVMANYNALLACLNGVAPAGAANSVQINSGSGSFAGVGPLKDGEVLIGVTGGAPQPTTITAGAGISVTNAPGAVTISASGVAPSSGLYHQVMSSTPTIASTGLANWLNQGPSSVSDNPAGLSILVPSTSPADTAARYAPAPTPPYTITALLSTTRTTTGFSGIGFGWYDGTAKTHSIAYISNSSGLTYLSVSQNNSITSWNSDNYATPVSVYSLPIWFQISDDGTNVTFRFSQDGANFLPLYTVAKSAGWLGSGGYSNIFFSVSPVGGQALGTIMSWKQQ